MARTLTVTTALLVCCYLAFALVRMFPLAALASIGVGVFRRASPLQTVWLNQHVEARVRATVFSISGQSDAIGQIAGGPVFGAVGLASVRAALVLGGVVLSPALLLYARTLREPETSPATLVQEAAHRVSVPRTAGKCKGKNLEPSRRLPTLALPIAG